MANQKQDDQLEHSYSSYVMIRDVTLKTCRRRWMIGRRGERGSGISVPAARHDDDDFYANLGYQILYNIVKDKRYLTVSWPPPKVEWDFLLFASSFHFLIASILSNLARVPSSFLFCTDIHVFSNASGVIQLVRFPFFTLSLSLFFSKYFVI